MAPEVIEGNYNEKCDIWSTGVLLYIMVVGKPPFYGTAEEIMKKVRNYEFDQHPKDIVEISNETRGFLMRMLQPDYQMRPSAEELLKDSWLISVSSEISDKKTIDKKVLSNLQSFQYSSKLQEAIYLFAINHF